MALERLHLKALQQIPKGRLLCLGYPDLLVSEEALRDEFKLTKLEPVEDPTIGAWHGWCQPMFQTDPIIRELGFEPTYIDIKPSRGVERVMDLNFPQPGWDHHSLFDAVADLGTLEHCLNIGQALLNVQLAAKPGAYFLHANPLQMTNHGWFSLSPELYHRIYDKIHTHICYHGRLDDRRVLSMMKAAATRFIPDSESMQMVIASGPRLTGHKWPMQGKYE